jgi:hypothetical protein
MRTPGVPEAILTCKGLKNGEAAKAQQKGCRAINNNNNSIQFNSIYLCANLTATGQLQS